MMTWNGAVALAHGVLARELASGVHPNHVWMLAERVADHVIHGRAIRYEPGDDNAINKAIAAVRT